MKNKKRIKQVLGILSILPTFTGQTEAKPITPNPTTEIKLLKDEAKPCPMTIESKQESSTLGLTNKQMGILLLGMLILPVTGIKVSEKGYELVKSGFDKLKNGIRKRSKGDKKTAPMSKIPNSGPISEKENSGPISEKENSGPISEKENSGPISEKENSSPISEIQKEVEQILAVKNLNYGVSVTCDKNNTLEIRRRYPSGGYMKENLKQYTSEEQTQIRGSTKKLVQMMFGYDYAKTPQQDDIRLRIAKEKPGCSELVLSMKECKKGTEELSARLRADFAAEVSNYPKVATSENGQMHVGITTEAAWTKMYLTLPSANKEEKPENPVENQEIDENAIATG